MARHEAIAAVPAAHRRSGRRQAGTLAIDPEQAIVVESEIGCVDSVVLPFERAARELHRTVIELRKRVCGACRRGRARAAPLASELAAAPARNSLLVTSDFHSLGGFAPFAEYGSVIAVRSDGQTSMAFKFRNAEFSGSACGLCALRLPQLRRADKPGQHYAE